MESNVNHLTSFKIKLKNIYLILNSLLRDFSNLIRENKANVFFLTLFLLTPFAYELLDLFIDINAYDNYLRTTRSYLVLSDYLTFYAQQFLGIIDVTKSGAIIQNPNSIIRVVTAYFYTFGFLTLSAIAFVMLVITIMRKKQYRRREPYVYIAIVIIMFIIDIAGYFFFPTAPPVRVFRDLFYRVSVLPIGDSLVSIKYNSIPSGHIYALTVPFIVAKAENYRNWKYLFGSGLVVTSWVILITGDHYAIDVFSAYFLCILLFTIFTTAYDYYNKETVRISKKIIIKRLLSLMVTLVSLILLSIITLNYVNSTFLIFQVFCLVIIWPIIVFTTNTDGLINGSEFITRSLYSDLVEALKAIKDSFQKSKASLLNSNENNTIKSK